VIADLVGTLTHAKGLAVLILAFIEKGTPEGLYQME